jgi:hypothetical protein
VGCATVPPRPEDAPLKRAAAPPVEVDPGSRPAAAFTPDRRQAAAAAFPGLLQGMPVRSILGEDDPRCILQREAGFRALWARQPWREQAPSWACLGFVGDSRWRNHLAQSAGQV